MKNALIIACSSVLALSACSEAEQASDGAAEAISAAADSTEGAPAMTGEAADSAISGRAQIPASMPRLAYDYGLSFELPSADVGKLMRRHATVCEQQGPQSCRIIGMDLTGDAASDDVRGTLQLAVAANHARAVSALLEDEATDIGAEQTATTIGSEEVSRTIVDTEARIRSREELRDRLMEVLRTRRGTVAELVGAERNVAAVNEEIDQAKSWLAETRGRVAFSKLDIDYASEPKPGASFTAPIEGVVGSLGGILGFVIAGLILLGALLAPIAGLVWAGRLVNRRFGTPAA